MAHLAGPVSDLADQPLPTPLRPGVGEPRHAIARDLALVPLLDEPDRAEAHGGDERGVLLNEVHHPEPGVARRLAHVVGDVLRLAADGLLGLALQVAGAEPLPQL